MSQTKLLRTKRAFAVLAIAGATAVLGAGTALADDHPGKEVCIASFGSHQGVATGTNDDHVTGTNDDHVTGTNDDHVTGTNDDHVTGTNDDHVTVGTGTNKG
ncbi:hypothetical protein [Streptomyces sp. I05A-00742]|uniref:hypothetical protein n=1 Tax=Streptomyces sp. I05A-00742 TaxID=2732853 RepID=UPI001487E9B5|nr:hypothetical protein [Streptomyces sp. I05A-00742]